MKQFPFAHTIEMTHRLQDGVLEVRTRIRNLGLEPMPVSIGFHPYFQLTDSPRDDWTIAVGARTQWLLAENKVPTGETQPIERLFPDPRAAALKDYRLDDVFGDLVRDAQGRAVMSMQGRAQRLDVTLGPNYRAVVIFAPGPDRGFVCFEPMAGITNAMNAAHKGLYKELQTHSRRRHLGRELLGAGDRLFALTVRPGTGFAEIGARMVPSLLQGRDQSGGLDTASPHGNNPWRLACLSIGEL